MSGIGGLAEGFLAGFNTMNNYYRGKKADERADKEMSLRDAMWQNTLDRQKVDDQRYTDETAYAHGRDSLADAQWDKTFKQNKAYQDGQLGIAKGNLAVTQARSRREQEQHALTMQQEQRKGYLTNNWNTITLGNELFSKGTPYDELPQNVREVFDNPFTSDINPWKMFSDPVVVGASKGLMKTLYGFSQREDLSKMDPQTLYKTLNTPETSQQLDALLKPEFAAGVGTATPMGVVAGYSNTRIVPTGDGNFFIEADVSYKGPDGKTFTKAAPITVNRSGEPDDPVRKFTAQQIAAWAGNRYKATQIAEQNPQMIESRQRYMERNGFAPTGDRKGFNEAASKVEEAASKAISDLLSDNTMTDPKTKQAAIEQIREQADQTIGRLEQRFGLGARSVQQWAGGDPAKLAFIQQNPEQAELAFSNGGLEGYYQSVVEQGWRPNGNSQSAPQRKSGGSSGQAGKVSPPPRAGDKNKPGLSDTVVQQPSNDGLILARQWEPGVPRGYEQYANHNNDKPRKPGDRWLGDDVSDLGDWLGKASGMDNKKGPSTQEAAGLAWAMYGNK